MKKIFNIEGMHCVSCETLLEKELKGIEGIGKFRVSYRKRTLEIEREGFDYQQIKKLMEYWGYKISTGEGKTFNGLRKVTGEDLFQIGAIFFLVFFAVYYFSQFDTTKFFPNIDENISFGIAILLGVVASVSGCLALTGGIVMSFSGEYRIKKDRERPFFHRALPQIYFHIGRIGGFAFLGGLLGLAGNTLNYSISFTGYLLILVAIIMFYTALHILNIVPSITRFGFHLPKKMGVRIHDLQKKEHPLIPGVVGVLTFFLPCGFTQSMQLVAVASGSFWTGALIMTFFALGTLPVLFLVGIGSSYAQNKDFNLLKKVVGVVIIFFALYSFNSGLVLTGSKFNISFWKQNSSKVQMVATNNLADELDSGEVQVVKMDIDYNFKQTEFKIKKGVPVRWEINAIRTTGCSDEVIIPSLDLSTGKLKPGINVLEFTPTESGVLPFSCWMGMLRGRFLVN